MDAFRTVVDKELATLERFVNNGIAWKDYPAAAASVLRIIKSYIATAAETK